VTGAGEGAGPPATASWTALVRAGLERAGDRGGVVIGAEEARRYVSLGEAIDLVREGVLWEGAGKIVMPDARRATLRLALPECNSRMGAISKCCAIPDLGLAGYRFVGSVGGGDPVRYLHLAGLAHRRLIATIDDHLTYLLRIAALAVVTAAHTVPARTPTIGMIGAGRLARAVLEALIETGRAGDIIVTSRHPASRERLVGALRASGFERARAADSARDVAGCANFLVTATNTEAPVLSAAWLKPGATIYALGDAAELPEDLVVRRARGSVRLIVSNWLECAQRADIGRLVAEGRVDETDVDAELWEVIAGRKPARAREDDIVCVRAPGSVGLDVLVGAWVCARRAAA
jgi:ornithine cyclodeaminase/alanine dehydrogenase-like protein (mu-crystallin family)